MVFGRVGCVAVVRTFLGVVVVGIGLASSHVHSMIVSCFVVLCAVVGIVRSLAP